MLGKRSFPFGMTDPILGTVNWWDPRGELAKMNQVEFNSLISTKQTRVYPNFSGCFFFFLRIVQNEEIHPIPIAKCPQASRGIRRRHLEIWRHACWPEAHKGESSPSGTKKGKTPETTRGPFFPLLTLKCMKLWQIWGIISQVGNFLPPVPKPMRKPNWIFFVVADFVKWTFTNTNLSQESPIGLSWASTKGVFFFKISNQQRLWQAESQFFLGELSKDHVTKGWQKHYLVGGWTNPSEKSESNWIIFPK